MIFHSNDWYPGPIEVLRGLWVSGTHWTLEIAGISRVYGDPTGQLYLDGVLLNQKYGYQEMFGYQLLDNKPFYFYKKDGRIHLSYAGQDLPLVYDQVPHYGCCSNGELNPRSGPNWLNFWGRRGTHWYYVQIGRYE